MPKSALLIPLTRMTSQRFIERDRGRRTFCREGTVFSSYAASAHQHRNASPIPPREGWPIISRNSYSTPSCRWRKGGKSGIARGAASRTSAAPSAKSARLPTWTGDPRRGRLTAGAGWVTVSCGATVVARPSSVAFAMVRLGDRRLQEVAEQLPVRGTISSLSSPRSLPQSFSRS